MALSKMRQHAEPSTGRISLKEHSCIREKYEFQNRTTSPLVRFNITGSPEFRRENSQTGDFHGKRIL